MNLDTDLVSNIRINLSAIERRTSTLTKRRSVKKEYQAAWLLKAISLIDLTTLSGDDTAGKVERLCEKAKRPISLDLLERLGLQQGDIQVGAVCVYHHLIKEAKKNLPKNIPVAAVSTGFPAGLSSFKTRKLEITESIKNGADEIDIVINRGFVLQNNWKKLYEEVADFKKAAKNKHIKAILGVGDLETLRNVAKASMVCMMAGADFIKTSTGKESVNATLSISIVMVRAIREYWERTGFKVGYKPAGGISKAKDALVYLSLMKEELGNDWLDASLFRFGASSLLGDIERQLEHYLTGSYSASYRHPLG